MAILIAIEKRDLYKQVNDKYKEHSSILVSFKELDTKPYLPLVRHTL